MNAQSNQIQPTQPAQSAQTMSTSLRTRLEDLYRSEELLIDALTRMSAAASSPNLIKLFNDHQEETRLQFRRLADSLSKLDSNALAESAEVTASIAPLIQDAALVAAYPEMPDALDEALIASAQEVEEQEIAAYTQARQLAVEENWPELAHLLEQSLQEERAALAKLSRSSARPVSQPASEVF